MQTRVGADMSRLMVFLGNPYALGVVFCVLRAMSH